MRTLFTVSSIALAVSLATTVVPTHTFLMSAAAAASDAAQAVNPDADMQAVLDDSQSSEASRSRR